jgi:peptidoglycan/xylan/chitin deacetylase (PgdA/CDA1 family)
MEFIHRSAGFGKMALAAWVSLLFAWSAGGQGQQNSNRQVAITIDDLPVAQSGTGACNEPELSRLTQKLLQPFENGGIPLTAFVIAGNCANLTAKEKAAVLRLWTDAGAELGNHTYSHRGLNNTPVEEYQSDILRADSELKRLLNVDGLRYFRSPMLQTGPTLEIKQTLERFLQIHGYQQAPVTFDNSDWIFAYVYSDAVMRGDKDLASRVAGAYIPYMESVIEFFEKRSVEVIGREFPQILLIHASRLNAAAAPNLLAMLKKRGYEFISLESALRDSAYSLPNSYAGTVGFSWIHRWSLTKGLPNKGEPDPPNWIMGEFERIQ